MDLQQSEREREYFLIFYIYEVLQIENEYLTKIPIIQASINPDAD